MENFVDADTQLIYDGYNAESARLAAKYNARISALEAYPIVENVFKKFDTDNLTGSAPFTFPTTLRSQEDSRVCPLYQDMN